MLCKITMNIKKLLKSDEQCKWEDSNVNRY